MKIGIDVHGVIDRYPELFSMLTSSWSKQGHEIHILTGQERSVVEEYVVNYKIYFDDFFSIVDHHKGIGTHMYTRSDRDGWWMDGDLWTRSKGDYASKVGLNLHFDDHEEYANYFPHSCTFVKVPEMGFQFFVDIMNR